MLLCDVQAVTEALIEHNSQEDDNIEKSQSKYWKRISIQVNAQVIGS